MALKRKAEVFAGTDGVLSVLRRGKAWKARGADWASPSAYETYATSAFASSQMRQADVALLGDDASGLTRKVRCRIPADVDTDDFVGIEGHVYDITRIDREVRTAWLYLSELVAAGTCTLISTDVAYGPTGLPTRRPTETAVRYQAVRHGYAQDSPQLPTATVRIRTADYAGERQARLDGVLYAVASAGGSGQWMDLSLVEREAQNGQLGSGVD